jgi:hypothetical protein
MFESDKHTSLQGYVIKSTGKMFYCAGHRSVYDSEKLGERERERKGERGRERVRERGRERG